MEAYNGSWQIDHSKTKNMEAFLKAAKFPEEFAKEMMARDYICTYGLKGDKVLCQVKVGNRPELPVKDYEFEMGKEIEIEGVDKDKTLATVNWDGTKFCERHRSLPGAAMEFEFNLTRELIDGQIIIKSEMNGVSLYEVYVKKS